MNMSINQNAISKTIIAIILVVVVAIGGIVVYFATTQNNPSFSPSPSPTSTATTTNAPVTTATSTSTTVSPSTSATLTAAPTATGSSGIPDVNSASSLKYSVSMTENGQRIYTYTLYGKNAGTTNFMMRIEYTTETDSEVYIINGALQKAWSLQNGEWQDDSAIYSIHYDTWYGLYQGYISRLAAWTGIGEYTYSVGPDIWRIYDIAVNPDLADSLFEHT